MALSPPKWITLDEALDKNDKLPELDSVKLQPPETLDTDYIEGVPRYAVAGRGDTFTKHVDKLLSNSRAVQMMKAIMVRNYTQHSAHNEAGVTAAMQELVNNVAWDTLGVYIEAVIKDPENKKMEEQLDELGDDIEVISQAHQNEGGSSVYLDLKVVRKRKGKRLSVKPTQLIFEYKAPYTLTHRSWRRGRTCLRNGEEIPAGQESTIVGIAGGVFAQTGRYGLDADCQWIFVSDGHKGEVIHFWDMNVAKRTLGDSCQQTEFSDRNMLRRGVAGLVLHTYLRPPVNDEERLKQPPKLPLAQAISTAGTATPALTHGRDTRAARLASSRNHSPHPPSNSGSHTNSRDNSRTGLPHRPIDPQQAGSSSRNHSPHPPSNSGSHTNSRDNSRTGLPHRPIDPQQAGSSAQSGSSGPAANTGTSTSRDGSVPRTNTGNTRSTRSARSNVNPHNNPQGPTRNNT